MNRRRNLIVTLVFLATALWWLGDLITPATELTRFRNSLLARVGEPSDFDWIPVNIPPDFRNESLVAPAIFVDFAREIGSDNAQAVPLMSEIVSHLRSQPKRKGPIKSTTLNAYRQITEYGRGYCADYTQVFNGLAHSVELPVREWGLSFERFSGDGHAFSEIYDSNARQWIFVDPLNGFYVRDRASLKPLSVLEFHSRLTMSRGFESVDIVPIGQTFRFDSDFSAFEYYQDGAAQFYLWFGNDVFTYDNHPIVQFVGPKSRAIEQLASILLGIHPTIRIMPTDGNSAEISALIRFRYQVLGLTFAAFVLGVLACIQFVRWIGGRGLAKS